MVEAAGIEPASNDKFDKDSTEIVCFCTVPGSRNRQMMPGKTHCFLVSGLAGASPKTIPLFDALAHPAGESMPDGNVSTTLRLQNRLHLLF